MYVCMCFLFAPFQLRWENLCKGFSCLFTEGVNKKKHLRTWLQTRGGGLVNSLSVIKIVFFLRKKRCRMFWNVKYVFGKISGYFEFFLSKSYVWDNSESINIHTLYISNLYCYKNLFLRCSQIFLFFFCTGEGDQNF